MTRPPASMPEALDSVSRRRASPKAKDCRTYTGYNARTHDSGAETGTRNPHYLAAASRSDLAARAGCGDDERGSDAGDGGDCAGNGESPGEGHGGVSPGPLDAAAVHDADDADHRAERGFGGDAPVLPGHRRAGATSEKAKTSCG